MKLRKRARPSVSETVDNQPSCSTTSIASQSQAPPFNLRSIFFCLLILRIINALLTRTFFQPDEHYQTTEIAHRLVFGYGFKSWEWCSTHPLPSNASYLSSAAHNLINGPIRSILHPLLFVPGYALLKLTHLDRTYALVLFPRLQQAIVAAVGDVYTFRLANRIGGPVLAWFATLVGLTNLYGLFTMTRTFSNSTEAAITAAALFYWPFIPFFSTRFDVDTFSTNQERHTLIQLQQQASGCGRKQSEQDRSLDETQVSSKVYCRTLEKSLTLAAFACLLRPTNAILWMYLVVELFVRQMTCLNPLKHKPIADSTKKKEKRLERAETQEASLLPTLEIIGEAANLVRTTARIGLISVTLALAVDTTYDCFANQAANRDAGPPRAILPALSLFSFLHKNVVANLSIFYGANPWHWYLTQGIPVLCTIWLPATLFGLITALQKKENGKGRAQTLARDATRSLARLACVTVGVYSLLGHKEFRFLQPLLPVLTILAASGLVASYADEKQNQLETTTSSTLKHLWHTLNMLPIWLRTVLLTFQPIAAMYLITMHGVGQEQIAYELGSIYRSQQQDASSNSSFSSSSGKGVVLEEQEFGQGFGKIHNLGFLMPCHSTPWATHLHDQELVERSWFIQCPPPPSTSEMTTKEREVGYWDQSDFFYHDPIKYLVERFPYNVDTDYPSVSKEYGKLTWIEGEGKGKDVWDKGWRHNWPSHLIMFDSLLREGTRKVGHTRTLKNLLSLKGYREVARYWNTIQHEDARRDGDVVVMAYKGPKSHG